MSITNANIMELKNKVKGLINKGLLPSQIMQELHITYAEYKKLLSMNEENK